jgi:hypothetical protein
MGYKGRYCCQSADVSRLGNFKNVEAEWIFPIFDIEIDDVIESVMGDSGKNLRG